uniref:UFSP1/2/DUB catalytic domain-containing protein n=1 Tax=Megaselia scalaris TaxID=36166 RepID=T1GI61_MEGSC
MDDQGNFRKQSAAAMQRAVYDREMSVTDYYERQVGLRAAESHGVDNATSCTKTVAPRVMSLSASSPGNIKSMVCSSVDHYASSYGDKGWGCGYMNLQMMWNLSSLLQGSEQLGCKLHNTRKWIGATEIVTVLSWLRINCQLVDFHRPTSSDGKHTELFNWVLRYFEEPRVHTPPLYLQHQASSAEVKSI